MIDGLGGDGDSFSHGILLDGAGTLIESDFGEILLTGEGGAGPGKEHGGDQRHERERGVE